MKIELRAWQPTDAPRLAQIANNPNIAKNLTNHFPHPYALADAERFIGMVAQNSTIFAIEIDGELSGGIGLHLQHDIFCKNAELGYWLAEPLWGRGIMPIAIKKIVDLGFQTLEIERIFARPFHTNIGSQRVLEKSGFRLEARLEKTIFKNNEFLDELIYSIRRDELYIFWKKIKKKPVNLKILSILIKNVKVPLNFVAVFAYQEKRFDAKGK